MKCESSIEKREMRMLLTIASLFIILFFLVITMMVIDLATGEDIHYKDKCYDRYGSEIKGVECRATCHNGIITKFFNMECNKLANLKSKR